ncbi:MAG: twin-arginine translocase TatA/TatE family subunit [Pseudomonadales bacterium]|nr:twin-arginine translocase TatA/TatE family subunit [Pseudomonadales bacterium]
MSFGVTELIIIAAIVLLLFGTSKLKSLGSDLGTAIKGFKSAMDEDKPKLEADEPNPVPGVKEQVHAKNDAKSDAGSKPGKEL